MTTCSLNTKITRAVKDNETDEKDAVQGARRHKSRGDSQEQAQARWEKKRNKENCVARRKTLETGRESR